MSYISLGSRAGGNWIGSSFGRLECFASSIISLHEQKEIRKRSELQVEEWESYLPNLWIQLLQRFIKLVHGVIRVGLFVVDHVKIARLTALERCNKNFYSVKHTV